MADSLSRMYETKSFCAIGLEMFSRNKTDPGSITEQLELIDEAHAFGNFGEQEVFKKLLFDGYWWPKIREQISEKLANCVPCLRYDVGKRGPIPKNR